MRQRRNPPRSHRHLRRWPQGRRAAFTLRLDRGAPPQAAPGLHGRGRSAQALVTEALDAFLGTMPELEMLAAQVKRR